MNEKIKKLIFEYSRNSRITTKQLGKNIRVSQQSASYLLNKMRKNNIIRGDYVIVDPVKLGFINVLVGFNFLKMELAFKREVLKELKEIEAIIEIEEFKEGVDLLVEFSISNLSAFNKVYTDVLSKFHQKLKTAFIFPIIVKHEYFKNYLIRNADDKDIVLSGDRTLIKLIDRELQVLNELVNNPLKKLVDISDSLKIPAKSVMKIKQSMEKKNLIKGYCTILDNKKLGINREIIFLRFSSEGIRQIEKLKEYSRYNKNIIGFMKVIGASQAAVVVESLNEIEIIKEIRSRFSIESYMILKSDNIHKKAYLPKLEMFAGKNGFD